MSATTTFPHFRNLPQELRDQIWNDALPEKDKPALYPWKKRVLVSPTSTEI